MANYLAQFQTIKNSLDHLVIAGKSHNSTILFSFFLEFSLVILNLSFIFVIVSDHFGNLIVQANLHIVLVQQVYLVELFLDDAGSV